MSLIYQNDPIRFNKTAIKIIFSGSINYIPSFLSSSINSRDLRESFSGSLM
jgi:hypothetical protein